MIRARIRSRFLLLAAIASAGLAGCGDGPEDRRAALIESCADAHVVIVLLDAAAAGHFGYMGYERDTTPHIDAIAQESVIFEQAYAQAASTPLSVFSMLSSTYPLLEKEEQSEGEIAFEVPAEMEMLPEVLATEFPTRVAVLANQWISKRFHFDQGFTSFASVWRDEEVPDASASRAQRVLDVFLPQLDAFADGRGLAYLHFLEPHSPYTPPPEFATRFDAEANTRIDGSTKMLLSMRTRPPRPRMQEMVRALYDGNVAYADEKVGELVGELKRRGIWEQTVFVLVADHGEAFWQHGVWGHGRHVYEEFVRVPFLLRLPDAPQLAGLRVEDVVSLVDLLPTLTELLAVEDPSPRVGRSLLPLLTGGEIPAAPPAFFRNTHVLTPEFGARVDDFKWVTRQKPEQELGFDLAVDPDEKQDLAPRLPELPRAQRSRDALFHWLATGGSEIAPVDSLDRATRERLESLGYFK